MTRPLVSSTVTAPPHPTPVRPPGDAFAYAGIAVGLGVSMWANVAEAMTPPAHPPAGWHADPGALGLAGFWPLILFLALEVLTRTTWHHGRAVIVARAGVALVAVVAAVVSYLHLHGLLGHYGEATVPALIGPLAIDGLMAVSTAAVLSRHHTTTTPTAGAVADVGPDTGLDSRPDTSTTRPDSAPDERDRRRRTPRAAPSGRGTDTAAAVARLRASYPEMSAQDIARRLKVTDRTVRRHLADLAATSDPAPGPTEPPETGREEPRQVA